MTNRFKGPAKAVRRQHRDRDRDRDIYINIYRSRYICRACTLGLRSAAMISGGKKYDKRKKWKYIDQKENRFYYFFLFFFSGIMAVKFMFYDIWFQKTNVKIHQRSGQAIYLWSGLYTDSDPLALTLEKWWKCVRGDKFMFQLQPTWKFSSARPQMQRYRYRCAQILAELLCATPPAPAAAPAGHLLPHLVQYIWPVSAHSFG